MGRRKGFTLLKMLLVITVVTVMAVMLLVPRTARADDSTSTTNLKAITAISTVFSEDVEETFNGWADYNWKANVGSSILNIDGNLTPTANCLIYESPKKYINFNAIYPDWVGVEANINLKKIGGDIWFKYCVKLSDEARTKLEAKLSWLKLIRLDVGPFAAFKPTTGQGRIDAAVKVVQWDVTF